MTPFAGTTSRNAPCPCGSGRRYKECHGAAAREQAPEPPPDALKQAAMTAQKAGRLDEAAELYARALARDAGDFDTLHMLGVTRLMQFRFDEAVDLITRALAVRPGVAAAIRNLEIAQDPRRKGTDREYRHWCDTRERGRDEARAERRRAIAARSDAPGISVIVPVFDTPAPLLRACLDSVLSQAYPHWELCIADDASPSPHVAAILREFAARDPRVKVVARERNGHISAASNSALALATLPWIALLDHDDLLAPAALAEMAIAIDTYPDTAIAYSDEDKVDGSGRRFEPYFKPAWNAALLRSQNVVSHLGLYRRELVATVGGFRTGFEGAQDWDLVLRCSERVDGRAIRHVPQVLYHWRAVAGSTALGHTQKAYAAAAQQRAVSEHWARRGIDATVTRVADGHHLLSALRIEPTVSLVVLGMSPASDRDATTAWRDALPANVVDIEIVPLAAKAGDRDAIDAGPLVLRAGDADRIHAAAARGRGEVVLFLRSDVDVPSAEAVGALAAHAMLPEAGPVGGALRDALGMPVGGGWRLDGDTIVDAAFVGSSARTSSSEVRASVVQHLSAVRGDVMAVRRALWDELGGYDRSAFARRYHDADLCLRSAARGRRPTWHPSAVFRLRAALSVREATRATDADAEAMRVLHGGSLDRDPAYHPELDGSPRSFAFRRDDRPADGDAR